MRQASWKVTLVVVALVSAATGAALVQVTRNVPDETQIATIVDQKVAASLSAMQAEWTDTLGGSIERFLLENPAILERVALALDNQRQAERRAASRVAIEDNREAIFGGQGVVVGNPDGDVTLVEFYDYNCEYCRQALPEVLALIEQDPNLRVLLRQFPILSQGSVDAAKVGILVADEGVDYWSFHQALFTARGQIDLEVALREASALGLDEDELRTRLGSSTLAAELDGAYELAQTLGINGTPTFILGDEIIPGVVGAGLLQEKIANVRACGSTFCPSPVSHPQLN